MEADFSNGTTGDDGVLGDILAALLVVGLTAGLGVVVYKVWFEEPEKAPAPKPKSNQSPKAAEQAPPIKALNVEVDKKLSEANKDTIVWLQKMINANFIATVSVADVEPDAYQKWNTKYLDSQVLDSLTMQKFGEFLEFYFDKTRYLAEDAHTYSLRAIIKGYGKNIADVLKNFTITTPTTPPKDAARAQSLVIPDPFVKLNKADKNTVIWVQRYLNKYYTPINPLTVDGKMGAKTTKSLGAYLQAQHPITMIDYENEASPNSFLNYTLKALFGANWGKITAELL
jgi:hypothetical protein